MSRSKSDRRKKQAILARLPSDLKEIGREDLLKPSGRADVAKLLKELSGSESAPRR